VSIVNGGPRPRVGVVCLLVAGLVLLSAAAGRAAAREQDTILASELLPPLVGYAVEDPGQAGIDSITKMLTAELSGRGLEVVTVRNYTAEASGGQATAFVMSHADTGVATPVLAGSFYCPTTTFATREMGTCGEQNPFEPGWAVSWGAAPGFILRVTSADQATAERVMAALVMANAGAGAGAGAGKAEKAPALGLPRLAGKGSFRLNSAAGQVIVLSFWSSKCAQCAQEDGVLERVAGAYGDAAGVRVVRVIYKDKPGAARAAVKKLQPDYEVVTDPGSKAAKAFGVSAAPSTVVIDRQGRVAAQLQDPVDDATLSAALDALLYGKPS
jgi:peroxiredoxin